MSTAETVRSTVYLSPELHQALRLKSAQSRRSMSDSVNDALRQALRDEPRPPGCEKLSGQEWYRVRQGVYRITCSIDDATVVVEVLRVGHRGEVVRAA